MASPLGPLDAVAAAPDHHKVLFENDRVRVLETRIPPSDKTSVHTHVWPCVLQVLSWSDFVRYDAEGNIVVDTRNAPPTLKSGDTVWGEPLGPHIAHNAGDKEIHLIMIELKD